MIALLIIGIGLGLIAFFIYAPCQFFFLASASALFLFMLTPAVHCACVLDWMDVCVMRVCDVV